jgi:hypothetical protein
MMAPAPAKNLTQGSLVASTSEPRNDPRISCASVPTMISVKAVETRNQSANSVARSANPSHRAASVQA